MIKLNTNKVANTYYTDNEGKVWYYDGTKAILYSSFSRIASDIIANNNSKLLTNIENMNNNLQNIQIPEDNLYGN